MDIAEFEKYMSPRAKRSRLEPYLTQIFTLKEKGYANWQIQEFLEKNDVKVTQEAVRKFIKGREGNRVPAGERKTQASPPAVGESVKQKPASVPPDPEPEYQDGGIFATRDALRAAKDAVDQVDYGKLARTAHRKSKK